MDCVNHSGTTATAFCQNCGKALCPNCVRNGAQGQVLCEPCFTAWQTVPNPFAARMQGEQAKGGLFFMNLFMSWVRFEGRGNRVTLCKMRSGESAAVPFLN